MIPPCRSCRKNGTEGHFCHLFFSQQRANVFLSDAWLGPATYHGSVVNTVTRALVRAPQRPAPLTFHGPIVGFVHWCLSQTRTLAVSNYHVANSFSGQVGPTCAYGVSIAFCFQVWNLFVERRWSCVNHVPAPLVTQVPRESDG